MSGDVKCLSSNVNINSDRLAIELARALHETIFTARLRISPRRVDQIAQEVARSFFRFLNGDGIEAVQAYGQDLAREGMGHRSILAMSETVRRVFWESHDPVDLESLAISGRYANALLEGYMIEREAFLLQQQERTHQAFERAREQ